MKPFPTKQVVLHYRKNHRYAGRKSAFDSTELIFLILSLLLPILFHFNLKSASKSLRYASKDSVVFVKCPLRSFRTFLFDSFFGCIP
mmetsp:Transcript_4949/g.9797  ORF Transcript_4949/g.9797 Transcript_4949/m.9797 type:complete len:87 (-) Transcript_4949:790-1050(-)